MYMSWTWTSAPTWLLVSSILILRWVAVAIWSKQGRRRRRPGQGVVMSWMLLRLESRLAGLSCRLKYFCAWLATCVGVRVRTEKREMLRQSPRPYFSSPWRNSLQIRNVKQRKRRVNFQFQQKKRRKKNWLQRVAGDRDPRASWEELLGFSARQANAGRWCRYTRGV